MWGRLKCEKRLTGRMKRRRHCRKCQTAQSSPAYTLTRAAEAADHLQAAKMVVLEEVKEHGIPDQLSEANKSIHGWACRSEEEQITLELLYGERRRGGAEGDYQRKGAEVGSKDCNVHRQGWQKSNVLGHTRIHTHTHIHLHTHIHIHRDYTEL